MGPSDRFPFGRRGQTGVGTDELLSPAGPRRQAFCRVFYSSSYTRECVQPLYVCQFDIINQRKRKCKIGESARCAALWPSELATWQRPSSYTRECLQPLYVCQFEMINQRKRECKIGAQGWPILATHLTLVRLSASEFLISQYQQEMINSNKLLNIISLGRWQHGSRLGLVMVSC